MTRVSELISFGNVYSRKELADRLGFGPKALERGLFTPRKYPSVLIFITLEKASHMTPYVDVLDGDDFHFDSELKGRLDHKVIEHMRLGLELLLFVRRTRTEHPSGGFKFEGEFHYISHVPGPPNRIHLRT